MLKLASSARSKIGAFWDYPMGAWPINTYDFGNGIRFLSFDDTAGYLIAYSGKRDKNHQTVFPDDSAAAECQRCDFTSN